MVLLVEPTGEEQVRVGNTDIQAIVPSGAEVAVGDTVRLGIDPEKALTFDASTGARLS